MDSLLEIRGLRKRYGAFEVLNGLNMTINKGDVYAFLGRNGSGKTTTMNIIGGLIPKDDGSIRFSDKTPKIGYLIETPALYGFMNGFEYLGYIAACDRHAANRDSQSGESADPKKRVDEVLELTGMTDAARRRIKGYSRGMVQRLGIAAAIFGNPDLLILDEPTSALDPEGRSDVMKIIRNLARDGSTIMLCTHILPDAESVANKVGILRDGVIAEEGYMRELTERYSGGGRVEMVLSKSVTEERIAELRALPPVTASEYDKLTMKLILCGIAADVRGAAVKYAAETEIEFNSISVSTANLETIYLDN